MPRHFVPGQTVRRRHKFRLNPDAEEGLVASLIARLNAARRAAGESDLYPGALATIKPEGLPGESSDILTEPGFQMCSPVNSSRISPRPTSMP